MVKIKKTLSKKENKFLDLKKKEKTWISPLEAYGFPPRGVFKKEEKCKMCHGFGWWPIGNLVPMGEMDSREWGNRVIKCPWCKAGTVMDKDRYAYLEGEKRKMEDDS